jgi:hypothetical protein
VHLETRETVLQAAHFPFSHPRKVDLTASFPPQVERVEVVGVVVSAEDLEVDVSICARSLRTESAGRCRSSNQDGKELTDNRLPVHELQRALVRILREHRALPFQLVHCVVHPVQQGLVRRRRRRRVQADDAQKCESGKAASDSPGGRASPGHTRLSMCRKLLHIPADNSSVTQKEAEMLPSACGAARAVGPRSADIPTSAYVSCKRRFYKGITTGTRSREPSPGNGQDCKRSASARGE